MVIICFAILYTSCIKTDENSALIIISQSDAGSMVRLKLLDTIGPRTVDSLTTSKDGTIRFHLKIKEPAIYLVEDETGICEVIVSAGDTIRLTHNKNKALVSDEKSKAVYTQFFNELEQIEQKADSLSEVFILGQYTDTFALVRNRVTREFDNLRLSARNTCLEFMVINATSLGLFRAITYSVRQTPVFTYNSDKQWFYYADSCLTVSHPNHRYTLWLKNRIEAINKLPGVQRGALKLSVDTTLLTNISLPGTGGKHVHINVKAHDLTLLHLWDNQLRSKQANPKLKWLYETHKDKGLGLYSVSFNENVKGWKAAIELNKMWWNHLIDTLGHKSEILKQLGNPELPLFIIFDKDSKIQGSFVSTIELEAWLKNYYNPKEE